MKLKSLVLLFFSFCWLGFSQQDVASIDLVDFNNSVIYGSGSGVTVHFNPKGIYKFENGVGDNQFFLELSDAGGIFPATPTILSTVDGFFITTINGIIPANSSGNYRLRVRASKGLLSYDAANPQIPVYGEVISAETVLFSITEASVLAPVVAYSRITPNSNKFDCTVESNFDYDPTFGSLTLASGNTSQVLGTAVQRRILISNINPNSEYTIRKIDAINGVIENVESFTQTSPLYYVIPDDIGIGTYNYEIQELDNDSGLSSTYTVVLILHRSTTTLGNNSSENVCVETDVIFNIDITNSGIGENYRGSYYEFDFGDGSDIEIFTHAEILANPELIHYYQDVSCNFDPNYFELKKRMYNKYNSDENESCMYQPIGNGVTKLVNTSKSPDALISSTDICENQNIVVNNLSTLGEYGLGVQNCDDGANFYWEIMSPSGTLFEVFIEDGEIEDPNNWLIDTNSDGLLDIVIPSSTVDPGCWGFRLFAVNQDLCNTESVYPPLSEPRFIVNVDAIADADFEFLDENDQIISEICFGQPVTFENASNVLDYDCQNPNYTWTISPNNGYNFVDPFTENSQSPDVIFDVPGVYDITLTVSNICGESYKTKSITILGDPTVDFTNPSLAVCENINEFNSNGYTLDFSNPSIAPTYSSTPYQPTSFTWTVTGGDEGIDYTFDSIFGQNTIFPIIYFSSFGEYVISVQVNGNCSGSNNANFSFVYDQTPIIENNDLLQELCSGDQTQEVVYISDMPLATYSYTITADAEISGYEGIDFSNGIPVMTLINSPPSNVTNSLIITVTPTVDNCTGNPIDFIFTVNPTPVIPNQTTAICSEETFVINPTNAPPTTIVPSGTTYVWTVADNINVTGEASETSSQTAISQQLINTTNTVQTVIYTVIPTSGADGLCEGDPFTVTVDVNPKPSIEDITPPAICSGNSFSETPTNGGGVSGADIVPSGTTYTWTVVDSSGQITGDSDQSIDQTSISQTLTNISNIPQTVVYTVVPTSGAQGNCEGDPFTITVVVNPEPTMDNVLNQTICGGSTFVTPTYNSNVSGVTYSWELTSTNIPAEISGYPSPNGTGELIGSVIQNSGDTSFTLTYNLSVFYDGCLGNTFPFSVTVDPAPTVIFDISNQGFCNGDASIPVNLSSPTDNVNISWSIDPTLYPDVSGITQTSGTTEIPSFTLSNTSNPPTPINLVFATQAQTGSTAGCNGEVVEYIITVNPPAQVNQPDDQVVCNGASTDIINFTSINLGNIGGSQTTPSGVDTIFLTFNQGYLGTVGSNTNQSNNILTFETLGILNVSFTQEDTDGNGLFDLDQGNDISGSVTINFTDGSSETFGAIINFRENLQNNQLEVIGFVFDNLVNYSFNYGNNQTYTIAGGTTPNVSTLMGLAVYDASVQFIDNEDRTSNAASAQTLDDLNNYLISVSEFSGTSSYTWVNDTPSIGLAASGNGPIDSFIAENLLNDPVVATITVTPYFESAGVSCPGTPVDFTITVNPEPVVVDQTLEVCSDEALGYT
ncbi:MAG: hypothetical protein O2906_06110, partial [Bacteroidetes bacterium]|nr:hypothetical protein [Bacteroidota bacterium]MDA1318745.1 hypothetical protein [Bacteroidota bacterium]